MSSYQQYQAAVDRILRYGLATIQGEATSRRCNTCGDTKNAAAFHPDSLLWGDLCLRCWSRLPGCERDR
jgi:hypothetical protein